MHPHHRSVWSAVHLDELHKLLDQRQAMAPMDAGRRPPASLVSDRHLGRSIAEAQADLEEAFLGAVGMLDHVRANLAAGDKNVVRDWWGGVDLSEPATQCLTQRGEH